MPDKRHVWSAHETSVEVYKEDDQGNLVSGGPILNYCYLQDADVDASLELERRRCTGRQQKKITTRAYEYSMSVGHFYWNQDQEQDLINMFNREQKLRIAMRMKGDGTNAVLVEDLHTLKTAVAKTWRINRKDNNVVDYQVTFEAEDFDQSDPAA